MTGKNPVSTLKNTTGNFDTKDFTISAKVIHQWQDGGKYYYNYQVSIKIQVPILKLSGIFHYHLMKISRL